MLVHEQFRKCVTFLYADSTDEAGVRKREPIGTALFVAVPIPSLHDAGVIYAVTARHVVEGAERNGLPLFLRMPKRDGTYEDQPAPAEAWERHPKTDVAAAAVRVSIPEDDLRVMSADALATNELLETQAVSEGDDVFFSGLFAPHYGVGRPQPIIRFGNISLMPREPVTVQIDPVTEAQVDAYLVEARSWGGQSGSPAFLYFAPDRHPGSITFTQGQPTFVVLGIVQGHWRHKAGALAPDPSGEGLIEINMGISIVIPAQKVMEVLMAERLKAQRDEIAKAQAQSPRTGAMPVADAALEGAGATERDKFEDLTRKLVNVPKREVDEQRRSEEG